MHSCTRIVAAKKSNQSRERWFFIKCRSQFYTVGTERIGLLRIRGETGCRIKLSIQQNFLNCSISLLLSTEATIVYYGVKKLSDEEKDADEDELDNVENKF